MKSGANLCTGHMTDFTFLLFHYDKPVHASSGCVRGGSSEHERAARAPNGAADRTLALPSPRHALNLIDTIAV